MLTFMGCIVCNVELKSKTPKQQKRSNDTQKALMSLYELLWAIKDYFMFCSHVYSKGFSVILIVKG